MSSQHAQAVPTDDIDLLALFVALWRGKWLIIATTILFAIAAVVYAINLPNIYRSEALLAPVSSQPKASGALSQLGGLASLAGINLGASSTDKTALALEVLRSRDFISKLIAQHDMLVPLLAAEGWDWRENTLQLNARLYDATNQRWVREVSPPQSAEPSLQEAYDEFIRLMTINQSKETGMVTLTLEHYSPEIARQWLSLLIAELNTVMRQRDMEEARRSMAYLEQQLQQTQVEELRRALFQLIEEQTKTLMLAAVSEEYVLRTIDPPVAPEKKAKPGRALICIVATIFGFVFGCFIVLLRTLLRRPV